MAADGTAANFHDDLLRCTHLSSTAARCTLVDGWPTVRENVERELELAQALGRCECQEAEIHRSTARINHANLCAVRAPYHKCVSDCVSTHFLFGQQNMKFGFGAAAAMDGVVVAAVGANGGRCDD